MHAGSAISRISVASLLLMIALVCAGCNLGVLPDGGPARFEGPPVIHIAAPLPDQTYQAGTTVIVQARVENAGPDLARVAVLMDEALLGERIAPNETGAAVLPLTIDWLTSSTGQHNISVVAERADGSAAREDVIIEVVSRQRSVGIPSTDSAESVPQAATIQPATPSPAPASPAPTASAAPASQGPSRVAGEVLRVANLRPGPGVASGLPLGSLPAETEVLIVALNPERDWYRISYGDGGDAWIDATFVGAADDTAGLPVETGASSPSADEGVNLLVASLELDPAAPACGQATTIRATVRNSGSLDSQTSPWVSAKAYLLADQSVVAENTETTYLPKLKAGEETLLDMTITIAANYSQRQQIRVTVDAGNHVLESNENDNVGSSTDFTLGQGNCA